MNILVTGGSSGLGKSIVMALSLNSKNIIYFTFNQHEKEAHLMCKDKKNVIAIKCDFTKNDDLCELEKTIPNLDLDVLINNAYVGLPQGLHFNKTDPNLFLDSFEKNVIPTIRITQSVISCFKIKKQGKIINILTSSLINIPPVGYSIYSSNKAYILQLSKSWNSEYIKYNITSNCISPDFMQTNLTENIDDRIIEQLKENHPLKKILTIEETTEVVLFFVGASQQINGVNFIINVGKNIL